MVAKYFKTPKSLLKVTLILKQIILPSIIWLCLFVIFLKIKLLEGSTVCCNDVDLVTDTPGLVGFTA